MARPARVSPDRILAAAAREFAERGYAGARVDRIARRARVNKAMLYYHFRSKQGLYRALLRQTFARAGARLQEVAASHAPPADKLDDTVKLHQVFGIGLAKLASARVVDREALTASPLHPAVHVRVPESEWSIEELPARLHAPGLDRHQRAVVVARSLAAAGPKTVS